MISVNLYHSAPPRSGLLSTYCNDKSASYDLQHPVLFSYRCTGLSASTTQGMAATTHRLSRRMTRMTWTPYFRSSSWPCLEGMAMVLEAVVVVMVVVVGAVGVEADADVGVVNDVDQRHVDGAEKIGVQEIKNLGLKKKAAV